MRRRERVIRIFPSRVSVIRLLGALLLEQDEQWSTGKRYLDMTAYWSWRAAQQAHTAGPAIPAIPAIPTPAAASEQEGQKEGQTSRGSRVGV